MNATPSINLPKLKALATAATKSPYDAVALNDYGMAVPPATVLDLIAEIERHRLVDAEGCKPEISTQPAGSSTADAAPEHDLDNAEGCKPDINNPPLSVQDAADALETAHRDLRDAVERAYPVGSQLRVDLGDHRATFEVLGHPSAVSPGAISAINIKTGKRRRLDYSRVLEVLQ
ncbi:hypothetical protein [Pseudomonas chlororaphis]|uniref:Uncharacterized protein n=1 Tax=Pseudomonas chlororaphis TaxID=587753 RepID=A0AAX3G529_9PSED|nr:hypothetical protein [Pseudomonas chlororaphis]AZC35884.1 hypothetical protein C4K37_1482 [Pseudomonas chlororaphis subsp. piscium]AZC42429.1 hypothetical protein C4K36_1489 [Pseudomonas chlororaphis subsp. piscium]WDG74351.1 hypothetical protein PUP65_08325 [Pseudomonas chlororaphis]WDH28012.1 hypothetical protein PUP81_25980 [Pseudomonas chlororaphis]WDH72872.1 hypothetical protein PUP78_08325 [Pseudomonas chlororaphis]